MLFPLEKVLNKIIFKDGSDFFFTIMKQMKISSAYLHAKTYSCFNQKFMNSL